MLLSRTPAGGIPFFVSTLFCAACAVPLPLESLVAAENSAAEVPHPTLPAGAGTIDAAAPKVFATTPSGLQYRVLRQGGGVNPSKASTVKVNYHGWLDNGSVFDSSYKRGEAIEFPLSGVIPGWTEGMQLVGQGGMIELLIPSNLGYGSRGAPPVIPPNATLHFLVELLEVR
jgi:FKBP-type peptidyl-prolyl cis-trans isomerase FkpA